MFLLLNVKSTTRGESQQVWVRDTDVHNLESGAGDCFSLTVAISPAPQASLLLQPSGLPRCELSSSVSINNQDSSPLTWPLTSLVEATPPAWVFLSDGCRLCQWLVTTQDASVAQAPSLCVKHCRCPVAFAE